MLKYIQCNVIITYVCIYMYIRRCSLLNHSYKLLHHCINLKRLTLSQRWTQINLLETMSRSIVKPVRPLFVTIFTLSNPVRNKSNPVRFASKYDRMQSRIVCRVTRNTETALSASEFSNNNISDPLYPLAFRNYPLQNLQHVNYSHQTIPIPRVSVFPIFATPPPR